ncbi:MAG TPA: tetratricopeptide repeat protein [Usitatibacter sp.]|nr:tetratricopeptide repeat protein [Usitatibacter sp.]
MSSSTPEAQALALFRAGRLAEARDAWSAILARRPDDPEALHMLGYILTRLGRAAEGLALIDRSIEHAPRAAPFLNNRAQVLAETGHADEAIRDLRRAVQLDPRFVAAYCHLGILLNRAGRGEEALAAFRRALAIDPGQPLALYNLGVLRLVARDLGEAEAAFRRVLEREPRNALALNNLGVVARDSGRAEEALAWFERACEADPVNLEALNNLALALRQDRGDLDAAAEAYARILARDPASPHALLNLASIALDRGRIDEAEHLYWRALGVRHGWADAEYGLGQVALRRHEFAVGWDGYERRFETDPPQAERRAFAVPRFEASDLDHAVRVAVWSEQGVGDQVLFSTLLPELARAGARAVVEVDERLVEMYRRSLPSLEFTTVAGSAQRFADCDRELPLGSLPRLFRRDAASFDAQPAALLQPDAARVAALRERLGHGRWIGISWRSLQRAERRALGERKSIPLETFAALAIPGVRLLDLQYGDVEEERRAFGERHPGLLTRLDDLDTYADLEGVAAAMAACERVVTASNVTAHLAGALGRPTQLLFLGPPPFSYWAARADGRCLWYPSVRIVNDPSWRDWSEVMVAARDAWLRG